MDERQEHGQRGSARPLTSALQQSMPPAIVLSRLVQLGRVGAGRQRCPSFLEAIAPLAPVIG